MNMKKRGKNWQPWLRKETRKCILLKWKLKKKFKKECSKENGELFHKQRKRAKEMVDEDRKKNECEIEEDMKCNPKRFFNYFSCKSMREEQEFFIDEHGVHVEGKRAADSFAKLFKGKEDRMSNVEREGMEKEKCVEVNKEEEFEINEFKVREAIQKIKNTKAIGTDGIPLWLIKGCADAFMKPLHHIFSFAIENGVYPKKWKEGKILPTFKNKGDKLSILNYRPITIINNCSKIFEYIIRRQLVKETDSIMSEKQHAYAAGKSTVSNLVSLCCSVHKAMAEGKQIDIVLTDFTSAFDLVDHDILKRKMKRYRLSEKLINVVDNFVRNRVSFVMINGAESDSFVKTCGVPQGSAMGGQLYVLYTNDIGEGIRNVEYEIYADDFQLYKIIECERDHKVMQDAINEVVKWECDNKLQLNRKKCTVITISRKKEKSLHVYKIGDKVLERASGCKDLGVWVDLKLNFKKQRENIINKARKITGYILRSTKGFKKMESVMRLYKALVIPTLEYAAIVWNPTTKGGKKMLESVQYRLMRTVYIRYCAGKDGVQNMNKIVQSSKRLRKKLGMEKLEYRRIKACISFFSNIIAGRTKCEKIKQSLEWNRCERDLRNKRLFEMPKSIRRNYQKANPMIWFYELCNKYNIDGETLGKEKNELKKWMNNNVTE